MPRTDLQKHFDDEPREWTQRKHTLLERYVVPAAMKIKETPPQRRVALVDGYAGPNEYAGEVAGSTAIMVRAAERVLAADAVARVYAFEADPKRYARLCENLKEPIARGILVPCNAKHAEAARRVLDEVSGWPMIVFLDPQTPAEMTLDGDLRVYCERKRTDVLGIFHAQNAARVAASVVKGESGQLAVHPREFLGDNWQSATTKQQAEQVFFAEISTCKEYAGMYGLRKRDVHADAYGIFGLSDSVHGIHLLSDAIAKDFGLIVEHEAKSEGRSLFADVDDEEALNALIEIVRPVIAHVGHKTGQRLAIEVMQSPEALEKVFGRYTESDYTRAARRIKEEESGKG